MAQPPAGTNPPRIETIRFARPTKQEPETFKPKPALWNTGILQDQLRKHTRGPWCPSFSVAFRIILLIRVSAAVYSNISDCDEVYNFWEPLHYLDRGTGFQTWETSPAYSIRSWAYILLHLLPARSIQLLNLEKACPSLSYNWRQAFFAVRIALAAVCSLCEAKFYRSVVDNINAHVGRYLLFFILTSTGMWSASTAFLPSSFAMFCNMLAFSYAFDLPSRLNNHRTYLAIMTFALGAVVGWPFSLAVAIPFVIEELFVFGKDRIKAEVYTSWAVGRLVRLIQGALQAAFLFIPVIAIDTVAYGKPTITPWNIIRYNIFSNESGGPELYGTEPWYFYILNLILNFNILLPLALVSLPAMAITHSVDYRRLGNKPQSDSSSPYVLLAMRLLPMYLWLGILTFQPHKEERFMFSIYPLICFNAAVALYLVRGWLEVAYIKYTASPYKASRTGLFGTFTLWVVIATTVLSAIRTLALFHYFHAPLDITYHFQNVELPRLLNVTNLLTKPVTVDENARYVSTSKYDNDTLPDLGPLKTFGGLRLCYGKEWYRFPGHYLIPDGVEVEFIKSDFAGLLPGHFTSSNTSDDTLTGVMSLWKRTGTRQIPLGMNDKNQEEPSHYVRRSSSHALFSLNSQDRTFFQVHVDSCDYLIDSDFSLRAESRYEPRYVEDTETWDTVKCLPFLDSSNSGRLSRMVWLPGEFWRALSTKLDGGNRFGAYCLLRHKSRAAERESKTWTQPETH
ncbi:mannosyltransferase [Tulasnella sp. 403]|nr:mannosyltransferase [Tulasnella sp. 403]